MTIEFAPLSRAHQPPPIAMLIGMAVLALLALLMVHTPDLALGVGAVAGAILIIWTAWRVHGNAAHLLCALVLIEELSGASFLPLTDEQHYLVRYPLLIAFCAAPMWTALRTPEIWRGGFRDYLLYLGLGVISISYSL